MIAFARQYVAVQPKQKDPMVFSLITKQGQVMQFYIRGVAELYKGLYGGVILTDQPEDRQRQ